MEINENWNFEEVMNNIKTLKTKYEEVLTSFPYFEIRKKTEFIDKTRKKFYSLNLPEWQIDKLWEYLNGYEKYYVLIDIVKRQQRQRERKLKKGENNENSNRL